MWKSGGCTPSGSSDVCRGRRCGGGTRNSSLATICWYCLFAVASGAPSGADGGWQRAGNIAGLENGRISLAKYSKMMTSSVHVELAGSEAAFGRLLDQEWDEFSALPDGVRSTFLVCSAPGRANAKRLRELAGAPSLVETLFHRKGEHLCSVASLDKSSAAAVAADGVNGDAFSLEPLPHLAKLAPAVAVDPSPAALLLSAEAVARVAGGNAAAAAGGAGVSGEGDGGGTDASGRNLRKQRGEHGAVINASVSLAEEKRARVLKAAAAAAAAGATLRPTTRRLMDDAKRGSVDAIEITLALHHERRLKSDTEALARRWLELANDQAGLAGVLREKHFWGGQQRSTKQEGGGDREREWAAHEERKRGGWASLLDVVDEGKGVSSWSVGTGSGWGRRGPASCGFDRAKFTVSPSGKKILLHRPHELAGKDEGCLSALLAFVSLQPEVHYVTARRKTATMNLAAAWVTQSGVAGYTPLWDENLQGQDEIIGVADTGLDLQHCHFSEDDGDSISPSEWDDQITDKTKRKVVQYIAFVDDFDEEKGHGTHVAGSIAGAQSGELAGSDEADGMAFQGKLAVFDFGDSDNFNALTTPDEVDEIMMQPAYEAGARVHSNSWDTVSVEYTSISKEVDEFVFTHQDFLVVFAAGNCGDTSVEGDLVDKCDGLDDEEGSVLSPAQAKNVVAVGATESGSFNGKDVDTVSYFSSKGPTVDGRIKPDVVAPGDPTWSASANPDGESCEFGSQTGTSMSTPVVAGNAAMARQYFREGWYNSGSKNVSASFEPSAALLKAVLINSAEGMEKAGVNPETSSLDLTLSNPPDEHQGHGRINMLTALNVNASVGLFFEDWVEISEGQTLEYEVSLYEDADLDKDLRITLVWTDPAAATGSTEALIHDLDLEAVAQSSGVVYYPNGGSEADTVNNVEKIIITDTTEEETYTIRVTCDELSETETQYFAVIANGEFIKTNALPTTPDPSNWLDLLGSTADSILTVEFAIFLVLGVVVCCALSCACRRYQRNRRHKVLQSKYRRAIANNRGVANGRKVRPPSSRPQPFDGPVRAPGESAVAGSGRFQESWRRPGPGSASNRSMRSEHSSRGALLTGAGALVPTGVRPGSTDPPTPLHEACPECGLRLPDVIQLVQHVETMHGGRAVRLELSRGGAAASATGAGAGAAATVAAVRGGAAMGNLKSPASRMSPPSSRDQQRKSAVVRSVETTQGSDSSSKTQSRSSDRTTSVAVRGVAIAGAVVASSTAGAAGAATASKSRSRSPDPQSSSSSSSRPRSRSPPLGMSWRPRSRSPPVSPKLSSKSSGDSSGRQSAGGRSAGRSSASSKDSREKSGSGRSRDAGRRDSDGKDAGGRDARLSSATSDARGSTPGADPRRVTPIPVATATAALPATNPKYRKGSGQGPREKAGRKIIPAPVVTGRDAGVNSSGGGGGSRPTRILRHPGRDQTREQRSSANESERSRDRDRGGGRVGSSGRTGTTTARETSGGLEREASSRSLHRSESLDRMSALSSRAFTRSSGRADDDGTEGWAGDPEGGAAAGGARGSSPLIRRMHTTEDMVPVAERLTVDSLRTLGSGLPTAYALPPAVFSPVAAHVAKEPIFSPVARARAQEMVEDRPVSLKKKILRQLSGEL